MNNLPIYFLKNNSMEGAPEGAKLIKGSTKVSEHNRLGSAVIVKVHNFYDNRGWVRVWVHIAPKSRKSGYAQTAIFENAWRDENPHWFSTYCTGSFTLEQWHQIIESLRPVEEFLSYKYRESITANST